MTMRMLVGLVLSGVVAWGCGTSSGPILADLRGSVDIAAEVALEDAAAEASGPDEVAVAPEVKVDDPCQPACEGRVCGDDGCGGSCGECGDNRQCGAEGLCVCEFFGCLEVCCGVGEVCSADGECCAPDCDGKVCGDDGCGESCGGCGELQECVAGACQCLYGICAGACCQEGQVCFEELCCAPDCEGKSCGADGCGGSCGDCADLQECSDSGQCECVFEACADACCEGGQVCHEDSCCLPDCEGKLCGDDGCGGSCGGCEQGYKCSELFACVCAFEGCGVDCCTGGEICTADGCCAPQCEGKECGDNLCGGQCAQCPEFTECSLQFTCECLFLACGGACCSGEDVCYNDACCLAQCGDKECGGDGCGGSCGSCGPNATCGAGGKCGCTILECQGACCGPNETCYEDQCCKASCDGTECGGDGCGGSCGQCDAGCYCGAGMCLGSCGECVPDCTGQECGYDGCGGSCGECLGNDFCNVETWLCEEGDCQLPTEFSGLAYKLNSLKAGKDGTEGQGVDVDNDPATCAPPNMCDGGRDNQFGALMKSLAPALGGTEPLMEAVETGDIVMVVELVAPKLDGTAFMANIFRALPAVPKDVCDFQDDYCDYLVDPDTFVPETCLPVTAFDNVQMAGNTITAGGPAYNFEFPFVLALTGGTEVILPGSHAKMVADLELDADGNILSLEGIIGCAVPKAAIVGMVEQIPEDALPLSKDLIMAVLDMVVNPDIDADGDGNPEAVSTGMLFHAIPGKLIGLADE